MKKRKRAPFLWNTVYTSDYSFFYGVI